MSVWGRVRLGLGLGLGDPAVEGPEVSVAPAVQHYKLFHCTSCACHKLFHGALPTNSSHQ